MVHPRANRLPIGWSTVSPGDKHVNGRAAELLVVVQSWTGGASDDRLTSQTGSSCSL